MCFKKDHWFYLFLLSILFLQYFLARHDAALIPLISSMERVNAHESLESFSELEKLRQVNKQLNIKHTVLIGHYNEVFDENKKWDKSAFDIGNNDFVVRLSERYPKEFSAIVLVNPADPEVFKKITKYLNRGAIGIEVYDWMFQGGIDHKRHDNFFQFLEVNQIPIYLRTSVSAPARFRQVDNLLNLYQFLKILIPHYMVSEENHKLLDYLMQKHENLYMDLSYGFKNWRKKHFYEISNNIDDLKLLIEKYQDRILFGTDVVISSEQWKIKDYIISSFRDYVLLLERADFRFSLTGDLLRGYDFDKEILSKIYSENFKSFFKKEPKALINKRKYLTRLSPLGIETIEDASVLLCIVSNLFSNTENLEFKNGKLNFPAELKTIYIDNNIKMLVKPVFFKDENINIKYLDKDELIQKITQDLTALGLLFLGDLSPSVKLVSVNNINLLDRKIRVDREILREYPLAISVNNIKIDQENYFNPYEYYSVLVTGSSLIGQGLNEENTGYDIDQYVGGIKDLLRDSDITHLSLENPIIEDCENDIKKFKFCTDSKYFDMFPYLGIDVVSLTGNHVNDFGRDAFAMTLEMYKLFNIKYFGGGFNNSFKESTELFDLFGTKVGFIGYNGISGSNDLSTKDLVGSNALDVKNISSDLKELKENADVIFVDFQAGKEFSKQPTYLQQFLSDLAIRNGANVVNSLHSHTRMGFKFFLEGVSFYGPGNFLFFHPSEKFDTQNSYIIKYIFHKSKLIQIILVPIKISDHDVQLGDKQELNSFLRQVWNERNIKPVFCPIYVLQVRSNKITKNYLNNLIEHFCLELAENLNYELVSIEQLLRKDYAFSSSIKLINVSDLILSGKESVLDNKNIYGLFSFPNRESLEMFKDTVQANREQLISLFRKYSNKIIFDAQILEDIHCNSTKDNYRLGYNLLTAQRDLLERDLFRWPHLNFCGSEWSYDYSSEDLVVGLNLSEDILQKIYYKNSAKIKER